MTPYGAIDYFYWVALAAIPALILGFTGRKIGNYGLLASMVLSLVILSQSLKQVYWLLGFVVVQTVLMKGYLRWRTSLDRATAKLPKAIWLGRAAALTATLPLAVVKISGLFPAVSFGFLGLSYLSFRAIQVILEITDGLITEFKVTDYLGFLLFFPTLSSGPIDRSRRFFN